jgi:hypothetical protein
MQDKDPGPGDEADGGEDIELEDDKKALGSLDNGEES